jgi:hypothetical protein
MPAQDGQSLPLPVPQPRGLQVSPSSLTFLAEFDGAVPAAQLLHVSDLGCGPTGWTASSNVGWLQLANNDSTIEVSVNMDGLAIGSYTSEITIAASAGQQTAVTVPVNLIVVEEIKSLYLPLILSP